MVTRDSDNPSQVQQEQEFMFPCGLCGRSCDGRRGSNVYEVNTWLCQFGRGKPRLGGLTVEETAERQDAARKASDKRRKEASGGRNDAPA